MTQFTEVHAAIRQRYGAIAEQRSSCCGPTDCCGETSGATSLYNTTLLEELPADVTDLSLGCGDPVTIAGLSAGERVLDLGSGGGIDCFLAARQVGPTGHVIGVDMTPAMLSKANANKARLGVENVEFREGQIEALPVEDESVDVVMSNCVINLAPDKLAVFREAFRVLRPGGRIAISDIVTEGEFSDELRADLSRWAECVTGAIDVNTYVALMRQAGFTEITVTDKRSAEEIVPIQPGMPRVYSARITAVKSK
ncbi:MAG: arsenite methyltransferase [Caldilinea sp.]|nr:arsenite methyltransferase [Caldilinea sp.]MDW8440632.1 arsenite methyltransferase [Caldilineaceae bacterium]